MNKKLLLDSRRIIFVTVFAIIGVLILGLTMANIAPSSTATEAESGTLNAQAVIVNDASASNGSFIQFTEASPPSNGSFPTSRDVYKWPFAQNSVWNVPIGSNAVYQPASLTKIAKQVSVDAKHLFLDPTAPIRTIRAGNYSCHSFTPQTNKLEGDALGKQIRIGDDKRGDGKLNGATAFLSATNPHQYYEGNRLWRMPTTGPEKCGSTHPMGTKYWDGHVDATAKNPAVRHSWGVRDLKGGGWVGGPGGGTSGSVGGTIRKGELTGSAPIRHAIRLNVYAFKVLARNNEGYMWPALRADANYKDVNCSTYNDEASFSGAYCGTIPYVRMGTLLALRPNEDISFITSPKIRKIANAIRDYGMYIVDNTHNIRYSMNVEVGAEQEYLLPDNGLTIAQYDDQMQTLLTKLYAVTNNSPTSIGGGGTPRQPLAPPFSN